MTDERFFKRKGPFSLKELATIAQAEIHVASAAPATEYHAIMFSDVKPLSYAKAEHITFLSNPKYKPEFKATQAGACIVSADMIDQAPASMYLLVSKNPYHSYAKIAQAFYPTVPVQPSIHPTAHIAASAKIGQGVTIEAGAIIGEEVEIGSHAIVGPYSYIGAGVTIGEHTMIAAHVTISYAHIGKECIIHSGVRIGQDGFGFAYHQGHHEKVPQLGRVIIGNRVEIGANSCIDRGAGPDTRIGDECKIDNLVQIGHNAELGRGCIIVAMTGIAGSSKLGDYVIVGGQVGIAGHLTIGSGTRIAAQSGITHDIPPQSTVGGTPAVPINEWHRQSILLKQLINEKRKSKKKSHDTESK